MTPMEEVRAALHGTGLRLQKAMPKGPDHLSLELRGPADAVLAGQWNHSADRTAQLVHATQRQCPHPGSVQRLTARVMVQSGGADRRLLRLQETATQPGAVLVAHRAERRGVVCRPDGCYTKLVRPGHFESALLTTRVPATPRVRVPTLLDADEEAGSITTAPLPGRTFAALLGDSTASAAELRACAHAIGRALADVHRNPPPGSRRHLAADEVDTVRAWIRAAQHYRVLPEAKWLHRQLDAASHRLDGLAAMQPVLVHGDLHDGQLLLSPGAPVGLLDFDLAAAGSPALDLGNLLAHLHLRALQGHCCTTRARVCADALLRGYAPAFEVAEQVPAYRTTTLLRLAAVYGFRPGGERLYRWLLSQPPEITHEKKENR